MMMLPKMIMTRQKLIGILITPTSAMLSHGQKNTQ